MTARYYYMDDEGAMRGMEWRPMTEEDRPLDPNEDEPEEAPDDPEPVIVNPVEDPKTDEVPE